ncbi:ABC transporter substrate-binding protein [Pigmentiphaga soli]|uniref:ABC transporter substrate-binding protein n=1 Tax=Pigmentiphaga soli TaxID=1007095 RepID=A0ABP8GX15_9BURK
MNAKTNGMVKWCAAALAACWMAAASAQGVRATDPNEFARSAVETVVKAAKADPAARDGDVNATARVVEREFLPYTDFERTTRLAVGAPWQDATPEQRQRMVAEFTRLLVRTYALQLTQIRNQDIRFGFKPAVLNPARDDGVVRTEVKSADDTLQVGYRLARTPAGWRIYDIDMMGVWLIQLYRKQFAASLAAGGPDALIKYLADHNARFDK